MSVYSGLHTGYGREVLRPSDTGPLPRLREFNIPAKDGSIIRTIHLRDGSVGFMLAHLALFWHEEIHPLNASGELYDEWGYALPREVRQGGPLSEHCGGAAIDLDATRHPQGKPLSDTFTTAQINNIHRKLKSYNDVLDWGGDYHRSPCDGMHFEWAQGVTLTQIQREAEKLLTSGRGGRIARANPGTPGVRHDIATVVRS